ncbi:hypothetical protein AAG906_034116 [Vitis piasezkii]
MGDQNKNIYHFLSFKQKDINAQQALATVLSGGWWNWYVNIQKIKPEIDPYLAGDKLHRSLRAVGAPDGEVVAKGDGEGGEQGENRRSTCIPHGSALVIGRRRAMEDSLTVAPGNLTSAISGEASEVDDMSASSLLRWMGSTAVLEVGAEKVVLANCGDLRAVQCRCGVAVQPSRDH